jgi:hypothetical protein
MSTNDISRKLLWKFGLVMWKGRGRVRHSDLKPLIEAGFLEYRVNPVGRDPRMPAMQYRLTHRGYVMAEAGIESQVVD